MFNSFVNIFKWSSVLIIWYITQNYLIYKPIIIIDYSWIFTDEVLSIFPCLRWRTYLKSATCLIGRIMSWPKIRWPRLLLLILWYTNRISKAAIDRIPIIISSSSTHFPIYCTYAQHSLIVDEFSLLLRLPVDFWLNLDLILYHVIFLSEYFKLMTNELLTLVIHDVNWLGIII